MANTQNRDNLPVEVCPLTGIRKEERIESFHKEEEKYEKDKIFPFSKYAAQSDPDVCVGNCEKCEKWETRTEKELYIRDNDTSINHVKYEAGNFFAQYFVSLHFMLIAGYIMRNDIKVGFILSLAFAMLCKLLNDLNGFYPQSFEEWVGEKFNNRNTEDK